MMIGVKEQAKDRVRDLRIERVVELVPPLTLLEELPLGERREQAVVEGRSAVTEVLGGEDDRLLVVVGPCSVHDPEAALDYAGRLSEAAERPGRGPAGGDAGLLREAADDDGLEGADQRSPSRRLRRRQRRPAGGPGAAARGARPRDCGSAASSSTRSPPSTSPTRSPGARSAPARPRARSTASSGSGLSMPVGFKNRTDGDVQVAVDAVRAASVPHVFAGIDDAGVAGDPAHDRQPRLPHHPARRRRRPQLRGGGDRGGAAAARRRRPAAPRRRRRLPRQQQQGPRAAGEGGWGDRRPGGRGQRLDRRRHAGVLHRGGQAGPLRPARRSTYGQSITDACMGWETTLEVLDGLAEAVRTRRSR